MNLNKLQLTRLIKEELKKALREWYGSDDKSTDTKWERTGTFKPHYTSHGADYERFKPEYKKTKLHPDHPEYISPEDEMRGVFRNGCARTKQREGWTDEQFERCLELTSEYHAKQMDDSFKGNLWQKVEHIIDQEAGLDPYAERGRRRDIENEKEEEKRLRQQRRDADREREKPRWGESKNLNKLQLTRLIKEEIRNLRESHPDDNLNYMEIMDEFVDIVDKHNIYDVVAVLEELKDRWETMQRQQDETDTEEGYT